MNKLDKKLNKDIAIIGMSGKFSCADNIEEFWKNIKDGKDCIKEFPESRKFDVIEYLYNKGIDSNNINFLEESFLEEIDKFDYSLFSLSPIEASLMDPNQRLLLESAWSTIENAGYGGKKIEGSNTGVFIGFSSDFGEKYKDFVYTNNPESAKISVPGNLKSIIASRISYHINLKGPAIIVDTACSSSLTALHIACKSLNNNECDMAIVGSVKIDLVPIKAEDNFCIGNNVLDEIKSSNNRTRTFDDESDGSGFGEGCATVLLKPLNKAIIDNDYIYAVIKGSSINQDGKSIGITAPNIDAQENVIISAWNDANVDPESISYIEAHGTGTKLGDPIEVTALQNAFKKFTKKKDFCSIGSLKTNIGHLDHAAGIAGLFKVVQMLRNKEIPPNVHFKRANKFINFNESPVYISKELKKLDASVSIFRCGISSFGMSGTNCHVVLEEAPKRKNINSNDNGDNNYLFILSALNKDSLLSLVRNYEEFLAKESNINPNEMSYVLQTGREHFNYRLAIVYKSVSDLLNKLHSILNFNDEVKIDSGYYSYHKVVIEDINNKNEKYMIRKDDKEKLSEIANLLIVENSNIKKNTFDFLKKIAEYYVSGADINWELFYKNDKINKIPVPSYKFQKKKCWVKNNNQNKLYSKNIFKHISHPLVDKCLVKTMNRAVFLTHFNLKKHWVLSEHKIKDDYILVGTTYLEMIREIITYLNDYKNKSYNLFNFVFLSPFILNEFKDKDMFIILEKKDEVTHFSFVSKIDDYFDNWIVHAEGNFNDEMPLTNDKFDMNKNNKKNYNKFEVKAEDMVLREIVLGDRWLKSLKETLIYDNKEFLALIELPENYNDDLNQYYIHPSLSDFGLNFANYFVGEGLYLPMAYKSIKIYQKMPKKFYSYLNKKEEKGNEIFSFDVLFFDDSGTIIAEMNDYSIKKAGNADFHKDRISKNDYFYKMIWKELKLQNNFNIISNEKILVFSNNDNIVNNLIKKFLHNNNEVFEVLYDSKYQKISDYKYVLSNDINDYELLFKDIGINKYSTIIHTWTINKNIDINDYNELIREKNAGISSLFFLTKALLNNKIKIKNKLILLSNYSTEVTGKEEIIKPLNNSFFGIGKVISQEYSDIQCKAIDIDDFTDSEDIFSEINSNDKVFMSAYRNGIRYSEELQVFNFEKTDNNKNNIIIDNNVYIITGGLGGLGLEIAKYLSSKNKTNIIMINRNILPDRKLWDKILEEKKDKKILNKIMTIKNIEENGSKIICYKADVCDYKKMKEILSIIRTEFGKISGVIHAAGIAGDGFIYKKENDIFQSVIKPKIDGTWILDNLTKNDNLDFFVMFSSITSILADPGQSDYVCGNSYLDSFVSYRRNKGLPAISINWPAWIDTGMAFEYNISTDDSLFKPILTKKGIKLFEIIIQQNINKIIPASLNHNVLFANKNNFLFSISDEILHSNKNINYTKNKQDNEEKNVVLKGKDNYDEIELKVGNVWGNVFELDEIDINDSFYNLGGDSLLATRFLKKFDEVFPDLIDIADIFSYTTINTFSEYLRKRINIDIGNKSNVTAEKNIPELNIDEILNKLSSGLITSDEANNLLLKKEYK